MRVLTSMPHIQPADVSFFHDMPRYLELKAVNPLQHYKSLFALHPGGMCQI